MRPPSGPWRGPPPAPPSSRLRASSSRRSRRCSGSRAPTTGSGRGREPVLTLYDAARCPFCARVRIVLAEKDVPHESVPVDLDDRPAWIVEKNPPAGRVPVLEEDGWVL